MSAQGKVAIVTGASQGIGAGLVEGFRARGYRVVANSRTIGASRHDDVVAVAGDVADPEVADSIISSAIDRFGQIDTLVANAGIFVGKPFTDYTVDDFRSVMAVNVAGFFHLAQRVVRRMLERGAGHIVTVTTSLVNQPMKPVPSALAALSKGGLDAVTRSLALEYADRGIRVNAVSPGVIATPMNERADPAILATLQPMGRVGRISEIVEAVLYLDAAAFVTGETLHVDGGSHAGRW
jgi:NAD(P)-dependent dehydrogenase (short-subunit alcohol dehydrogenase family)